MKIQAAVIFGGRSVEHEVSVITGLQVMQALPKERYDAIPLYIAKDGALYSGEEFGRIENYKHMTKLLESGRQVSLIRSGGRFYLQSNAKKMFGADKPQPVDVAIPAVHGTFVEDGSLQGFLELLGLPYCGCDVLSSALCMDKTAAKGLLRAAGLPVLPDVTVFKSDFDQSPDAAIGAVEDALRYPLIVKPVNLGSSVGIAKAKDRAGLIAALELALSFSQRAIVEPVIAPLREVNVSVLGSRETARASVCEEPVGQDEILSYQDKYLSGSKSAKGGMSAAKRIIPAPIDDSLAERIGSLAVEAFRTLGCYGLVRIDFLLNTESGETFINEVNTLPGSMAFYLWEATGLSFSAMLEELVTLAFARQRGRDALTFTYDSNLLSTARFGGVKG